MTTKSFKRMLINGAQDKIYLSGGESDIGYRITKLSLISKTPGAVAETEGVIKVFREKQTSIDAVIDFTDDILLAAAAYQDHDGSSYPSSIDIVFDDQVINQDIYITWYCTDNDIPMNYLIHLEEVKMSGSEQAVVNFEAALLHGE